MRFPRVLHPVLLAAFPILFLYARNADITPASLLLPPLLLSIGATLLVWLLLNLVMRDAVKSGLMTTALLVLFFSYGHVHATIEGSRLDRWIGGPGQGAHLYLSACYGLLAITAVYFLWKTRRNLAPATRMANVFAMVLVLLQVAGLALHSGTREARPEQRETGNAASWSGLGDPPDIYYIILDGYARTDTLKRHYGFDNGPFISALERKGFWIAPQSTSNYYWTFLSLASSLNMAHVTYLKTLMGETSTDRYIAYQAVRDNAVARFLRDRGYTIVHFASTWGATLENPFADETIECRTGLFQIEFYRVLAETTWLRARPSQVATDLAECHLSNFGLLGGIATRRGPKFVFAHFIPPHHPYLFDRHGNVLREATVTNQFELQERLWERTDQYLDQLMFVNRKVAETVDAILATSVRPPIIIIQSDHGPHVPNAGGRARRLRFANLAAFYFPDRARFLPDTVTSVNVFRHIFNHYFAANLPLLDERHYFSGYRRPYAFREVDLGTRADRDHSPE